MRQLKLRYVSSPKAGPDANPVETIFSDLQLMVMDNSNDLDTQATKRRMSRYLKAKNLCKDRWVKIPYLPNSKSN